ncbi:MAG TPA: MFS transporter [Ktedonobacteraceae bacterium]|jgi:MFS family permease
MLTVLRRRNFALLWLGQLISTIGDLVLIVALPFYVYQLSGSVLQTGLMFIVETLPRIFFGSLAGVFVDRWNRRLTMLFSDIARAAILLLLLFVHAKDLLWLVYVVACIQTIAGLFFNPAYYALTPSLVDEEQLPAANALEAFSDAITRFIGPPLGGILFGLLGLTSIVALDSASFLFSALMILLMVLPTPAAAQKVEVETPGPMWIKVWREWLDGLKTVREDRVVMAIFATMGAFMLAQGIINVVLLVFVKVILKGDASTYGWLITTQGIGTLIGSLIAARASKLVAPGYLLFICLATGGMFFLLFLNFPSFLLGLLLIPIIGIGAIIALITIQTLLQNVVTDKYRGRVFGAYSTTIALALLLGMLIASSTGDWLGAPPLLDGAGGLILLGSLLALITLRHIKLHV